MLPVVVVNNDIGDGLSTMLVATGVGAVTVTLVLALADPDVAVIVAVPVLTPVIVASGGEPDGWTLATALLLEAQVIDATDIGCPFWSYTVACSEPVAFTRSVVDDGLMTMVVGTGIGGS